MGAKATGMHHSLRNPFVVEMEELFPKMEVLERLGPRFPIRKEF
jgi:hypothetical protein